MGCILQIHDIIDRCKEVKGYVDDLQIFREGFLTIMLAVWIEQIVRYALSVMQSARQVCGRWVLISAVFVDEVLVRSVV